MQANEVPPPATASGSAQPPAGNDDNVQMSGQQIFVLSRKFVPQIEARDELFERRTNKDKFPVGEYRGFGTAHDMPSAFFVSSSTALRLCLWTN